MYQVDGQDRVRELLGVPQSAVGAPIPFMLSEEGTVVLAYYLEDTSPAWDGTRVRVVGPSDADEPVGIVHFNRCYAHMFGPPNDEAFSGHPLASRGLQPYAAFEIEESSWLRRLEILNSVHPYHQPAAFKKKKHLIFAFHDSTFECICESFDVQSQRGSILSLIPKMLSLFGWSAG